MIGPQCRRRWLGVERVPGGLKSFDFREMTRIAAQTNFGILPFIAYEFVGQYGTSNSILRLDGAILP
jgi:hypothetical protein